MQFENVLENTIVPSRIYIVTHQLQILDYTNLFVIQSSFVAPLHFRPVSLLQKRGIWNETILV